VATKLIRPPEQAHDRHARLAEAVRAARAARTAVKHARDET
jgi:hypothetical protein